MLVQHQTNRCSQFCLIVKQFQFTAASVPDVNGDVIGFLIADEKVFAVNGDGKISGSITKSGIFFNETQFSVIFYQKTSDRIGFATIGGIEEFSVGAEVNISSAVFFRAVGYQRCFLNYTQFSIVRN